MLFEYHATMLVVYERMGPTPVAVTGYNVYREASGGSSFQLLTSSPDTQTSYVDQNVVAGSSYTYYVKSVDSAGTESTDSNQVSVTIP